MIMFTEWTQDDLDYLLSLNDAELEAWLNELPISERAALTQSLLDRQQAMESDQPAEKRTVRSKGELAVELGMSVPMLDRYVKQGMPARRPPYDVELCGEWLDKVRTPADEQSGPLRQKRLTTEIAEREQSVRSKRLKNDILEGRLVYADEVHQQRAMEMLKVKQRLESIPDELQKYAPAEYRGQFRADLAAYIHSLLVEMSDWKLELPTNDRTTE